MDVCALISELVFSDLCFVLFHSHRGIDEQDGMVASCPATSVARQRSLCFSARMASDPFPVAFGGLLPISLENASTLKPTPMFGVATRIL